MFKHIKLIAFALIAIGVVGSLLTFSSYYKSIAISDTKTISSTNITDLDVDLHFGEIDVVPTSGEEIMVEVRGKMANGIQSSPIIEVKGNELEIKSEDKFEFLQLGLFKPELKVTVYLPQKQYKQIDVKTSLGDIDINQAQATSVEAMSKFGGVDLQDVKSESVVAKSDLGNIELTRVEGVIKANTKFGDVEILVHEFLHAIDAQTELGEIEMETKIEPKNVRFDVGTDLGNVRVFNQKGNTFTNGNGSVVVQGYSKIGNVTIIKR
jgi:DUF4097 and DUF4098 domain-containing protein YvlB